MLDFMTLMVGYIAIMVVNITIFLAFYKFSDIDFGDFKFWVIAYILHTLGLGMFVIAASHFNIWFVIAQNLFIYIAGLFKIFGTNYIFKDRIDYKVSYLFLLFVPLILLDALDISDVVVRIAYMGSLNIIVYVIMIYYINTHTTSIEKSFTKSFKIATIGLIVVNLLRISTSVFGLENTFIARHTLNSIILILGMGFHTLLAFSVLFVIYGRYQYRFVEIEYELQKRQATKDIEEKFQQLFEELPLGVAIHRMIFDKHHKAIDYEFLDVNKGFEEHTSLKKSDIIHKTVKEFLPGTEDIWIQRYEQVVKQNKVMNFSGYSREIDRYFDVVAYPLDNDEFVTIVHNTTSEINRKQQLRFLSTHDYLTGLKNRHEFVNDLETLTHVKHIKTTLIIFDIDGLQLFNDAFGHEIGDAILIKVGNVLVDTVMNKYYVYRISGDSFAVILTNDQVKLLERIDKLKQKIEKISHQDFNVSITFAIKERANQSANQLIIDVEKELQRNKAKNKKSKYSTRISAILDALTSKYDDEKHHSDQVKLLCKKVGEALGLNKKAIDNLMMAGHLHDIGKIAIPEEVLHKPGRLTDEEYDIVKTHAEIGYRILNAVDEYQEIALATLHHHERYDGKGYPKGLSGEDIPLISRIISVVDAYEAMTSDRVYRKSLGKAFAIQELKACSGSQFDPKIVDVFIRSIDQRNHVKN